VLKLKLLSLAFVLILMYSSTPIVVQAQANNNLEWGVDVGEEFIYVLQRAYFADPNYVNVIANDLPFVPQMTVGQKAIMRVTGLDPIPMQINETSQLANSTCDLVRANDSTTIGTGLNAFVVPIGDWDFLTDMANITGLEDLSLIDTQEEWGTIGIGSFFASDGSVISITYEVRYDKENGTLNYLRYRYTTLGTDLIDIIFVNWHPGMPTILPPSLQIPTVLIISIAAVVVFIVSVLVYQGYRRKKPIVQRLGE
jgi:hypothetical protein